jgi:hypothetical protein
MNIAVPLLLQDAERLVCTKTAAQELGLTNPRTLVNWRAKGLHPDLQYIRIGRTIRYRLGALREFKARHTVNARAPP